MAIDTTTGPHAVKPITDLLTGFTPVQKPISNTDNATLTYNILNWSHAPTKPPPCPNTIYGSLTIQREQSDAEITYHIHQKTRIGGEPTILNADIICNLDDTLKFWTLRTHREDKNGTPVPISELRENWKNDNGHIQSQDGVYEYHATHPVLSLWTLPHILMRESLSLPITFDMLQDLSLFRPNQTLTDDGPATLDSGTYKTYAQTGEGILPIHYLLDEHRRPQLITFGLIAWSLTDIS
jgi:hypothetical protein